MFLKRAFSSLKDQFSFYLFNSEFWNASLLIIGTCVGGGITMLPSVMSEQGCLMGLFILTLSALFSAISSLLLLEIFSSKKPMHFFSLFEMELNPAMHTVAILIYVFICFSSIVAYISGISSELDHFLFPGGVWTCLFVTFCGICLLSLPRQILMKINSSLVRGLFLCFFFLVLCMTTLFKKDTVFCVRNGSFLASLPFCLMSFSHQMIIPSLQKIFRRSVLRASICFGIFITWLIFTCWVFISLGVLPLEGPNSLSESYQNGIPMKISLVCNLSPHILPFLSNVFNMLALSTSFIGITLSFLDFLEESLNKTSQKEIRGLSFFILLPSCLFAFLIPKVFFYALDLSGGIGDSILYGLLPSYLILSRAKKGLFTMNLFHWKGVFFLLLISSISLVLECKNLFF